MIPMNEIKRVVKECGYWPTVDPRQFKYSEPQGYVYVFVEYERVRIRAVSNPPDMKEVYRYDAVTAEELEQHLTKAREIVDALPIKEGQELP